MPPLRLACFFSPYDSRQMVQVVVIAGDIVHFAAVAACQQARLVIHVFMQPGAIVEALAYTASGCAYDAARLRYPIFIRCSHYGSTGAIVDIATAITCYAAMITETGAGDGDIPKHVAVLDVTFCIAHHGTRVVAAGNAAVGYHEVLDCSRCADSAEESLTPICALDYHAADGVALSVERAVEADDGQP